MNAAQRRQFLASCGGSVCVAYTRRAPRAALGARVGLGLVAALALSPALAEPQDFRQQSPAQTTSLTPAADYVDCDGDKTAEPEPTDKLEFIVVGGVANPRYANWVDEDSVLPVLPELTADAFLDAPASAEFVTAPTGTPE